MVKIWVLILEKCIQHYEEINFLMFRFSNLQEKCKKNCEEVELSCGFYPGGSPMDGHFSYKINMNNCIQRFF